MRLLLAMPVVLSLAACNQPASSPDDGRIVVLEKQNKAFEDRVTHLERDLAEVRAQLAQAAAAPASPPDAGAPAPPKPAPPKPASRARETGY